MKYDTNKPMTRNAKRTLSAFCIALKDLLKTDGFSKLSVNKLCDRAGYPRATFYNYFDDKYDLLEFFWTFIIKMKVMVDMPEQIEPKDVIKFVHDKIYDFGVEYQEDSRVIYFKNYGDAYFMNSLRLNLRKFVLSIYEGYVKQPHVSDIPEDLLSDNFVNVVSLLLEYKFIKGKPWDKETMYSYCEKLSIL